MSRMKKSFISQSLARVQKKPGCTGAEDGWNLEIHVILVLWENKLSRLMRKPTICICENKGTDQLCGNREAGLCLCFRYSDSTLPLLLKSEILACFCDWRPVCVGPGRKTPNCWFSHVNAQIAFTYPCCLYYWCSLRQFNTIEFLRLLSWFPGFKMSLWGHP